MCPLSRWPPVGPARSCAHSYDWARRDCPRRRWSRFGAVRPAAMSSNARVSPATSSEYGIVSASERATITTSRPSSGTASLAARTASLSRRLMRLRVTAPPSFLVTVKPKRAPCGGNGCGCPARVCLSCVCPVGCSRGRLRPGPDGVRGVASAGFAGAAPEASARRGLASTTNARVATRCPPRMRRKSARFFSVCSATAAVRPSALSGWRRSGRASSRDRRSRVRLTGACDPWIGGVAARAVRPWSASVCGSRGGVCAPDGSVDMCVSSVLSGAVSGGAQPSALFRSRRGSARRSGDQISRALSDSADGL